MKDCCIVEAPSLTSLVLAVTQRMAAGWEPCGGVSSFAPTGVHAGPPSFTPQGAYAGAYIRHTQAMTRDTEHLETKDG